MLVACGVAATALYIGLDAVAAMLYDGYSYRDQTISELSAIGASTRRLWMATGSVYALLMIAFSAGVWMSAGRSRALRCIALLAGVMGIVALAAWPFAPMHQREELAAGGGDWRDTMHLVLSGIDAVVFIGSMAVAIVALRGRFRTFSVVTLAAVLASAMLMNVQMPKVQDDEPTPWLGVYERIAVLGSMLWYAALGVRLWGRGDS